jgi:hypothetical protein
MRARLRGIVAIVAIAALAAPAATLGAEAPCEGDECQGPPPAPEEVIPATAVVSGPENPPVRFPQAHKPKPKPKHKGHHRGKRHHKGKRGAR